MRYIKIIFVSVLFSANLNTFSQNDTNQITLNQDAIYNRPFIGIGNTSTAVGGYLEGNTNYISEDGVTDGFTMEMRRFNIFLYSQISNRIRFLSELEFEHGTEEIALETALLDFQYNSGLNLRMGIILPAIGLVNTNHDSPNWEFVERPLSSTNLIPTTLSEVGFGLFGKFYPSEKGVLSYDIYLTNGLQDGIILNAEGRTNLESGKTHEILAEDNNGSPMVNGRLAYKLRNLGEFGLAYYGGIYNTFRLDGEQVDSKRRLNVLAMDFSTQLKKLTFQGELVGISVDVPSTINEIYGEKQYGGFADFIYPIRKGKLFKFNETVVNTSLRIEYVDYNFSDFTTNITNPIWDEDFGLGFGLSFRPVSGTLLRLNYTYHYVWDALGNPAARIGSIQFGFASYF